jgi:hypothetical protein
LEQPVVAGLSWQDFAVVLIGVIVLTLHFVLPSPLSHWISPWFIGSIVVGWVFGRVAIDRIERS